MTYLRTRYAFVALLAAFLALPGLLAGCGSDPVDPLDNQGIEFDDVGFPDVPDDPDVFDDPDVGDVDDDADTGPIDHGEAILCDSPIAEPPPGERCSISPGSSDYILLRGTILAGDDVYIEGGLLLDDQSPNREILCVGCDCADELEALDATIIECPDGVISPGLINPHDHLTFAEGRPQLHGEERYDHRHDWRRGLRGHTQLSTSPRTGSHREVVLLGELRMLFGGSTSIAGSVGNTNASGFLRNLDNVNHTEGLSGIDVNYSTFPLGDGGFPALIAEGCAYPGIQNESNVENSNIYLPHIGEGVDLEAQNELTCLAGASGRNLVRENTSIIHGIAVNARDVALIADRGANLVWSPRTNIDLYGNTAPVPLYHRFGVPISLGTDWSTSGSMNMLRELQCADYLNRMHFNETFTDREIWQMATYNGAISMGAEHVLGLLAPGYVADITIFDARSRSPYRAVIDADIDEITLVMRGGNALYGDAELIAGLVGEDNESQCEVVDVCDRDRRLCAQLDAGMSLSQIMSGVHSNSYPIFFCEDPENEPTCVPSRPSEYTGIASAQDRSGDGIPDSMDNCPDYFNPIRPMDRGLQSNINGNSMGDVCDPCPLSEDPNCTELDPNDWSGDGWANDVDNCPFHYNPDQEDTSGDGIGDVCHPCPEHALVDGNPCPRTIYEIKSQEVDQGERAAIEEAVVTASLPGEAIFIQVHPDDDAYDGAEFSGLYIFLRNNPLLSQMDFPAQGDRIRVAGTVQHFFGQIQLASVTDIEVLSSGNPLPEPVLVDPTDVATGGSLQHQYEGVLVEVNNVVVTDIDVPAGPGDSDPTNEFIINDSLHVNNFFHLIDPFPQVGEPLQSITGVIRFANSNNKLEPRSADDIITGPPELAAFEPEFAFLEVSATAEPVLDLWLNRPAEEAMTVGLSYSDSSVIEGPATVEFAEGDQVATIDLRALVADDDAVTIEASLDGLVVSASVRAYDDDTPRTFESFGAEYPSFFIGETVTFIAELSVPAGSQGVDLDLDILPASDATYPAQSSFAAGQRLLEVDVELGSDTGQFIASATIDGTTLTFTYAVFEELDQFVETFDNLNAPGGSYGAGSFVGDAGFSWEYSGVRLGPISGAPGVDGASAIFGSTNHDPRYLTAEDIPGGISSFSIDMVKAFTGTGTRQLELFINGESRGVSTVFGTTSGGDDEVRQFVVEDLDVTGDFDMEIRSIGTGQLTIDNLTWTSSLPDDSQFPTPELSGFTPSSIYLEPAPTAAPVMSLELTTAATEVVTVDLTYSDTDALEGPAQVIFEVGESSVDIELRGLETRPAPITIEATYDGVTVTGSVRVDDAPYQIDSLTTACPNLLLGQTVTFTVELDEPVGAEGLIVPISISPEASVSTPVETVTFADGQSSAEFSLTFDGSTGPVAIGLDTGADTATIDVNVVDITTPVVEDFATLPSSGSYGDGTFTGAQGIQWIYGSARGLTASSDQTIDAEAMLFGGSNPSFIRTEAVAGGISSFSVDMRKAFTSSADRQLELFVNEQSVAVSDVFGDFDGADATVLTFEVDDLDISCVQSIELRSIGAGQVTIDNLTWSPLDP